MPDNAKVIPFEYEDRTVRVVKDEEGNPWWVAKDVCDILGLSNARDAISSLDEDERGSVGISDGTPGNPNMNTVNEPGLYTLIIRSNKPEARAFKRWITHEVLPAIRRKGRYDAEGAGELLPEFNHAGLKPHQRIRLLELAQRMTQMDPGTREDLFDTYNRLCQISGGTLAFQSRSDGLGRFLAARCSLEPGATVGKDDLYDAYADFAARPGHDRPPPPHVLPQPLPLPRHPRQPPPNRWPTHLAPHRRRPGELTGARHHRPPKTKSPASAGL